GIEQAIGYLCDVTQLVAGIGGEGRAIGPRIAVQDGVVAAAGTAFGVGVVRQERRVIGAGDLAGRAAGVLPVEIADEAAGAGDVLPGDAGHVGNAAVELFGFLAGRRGAGQRNQIVAHGPSLGRGHLF